MIDHESTHPQDFGEFMRENRLTPVAETAPNPGGRFPADRAKAQLERYTRYWPMIISQTTIFNMQAVRGQHTHTHTRTHLITHTP